MDTGFFMGSLTHCCQLVADKAGDWMNLLYYDFEVFCQDWMVVILNGNDKSETVIVNDRKQFIDFYNRHRNDIWIGFNTRHYDQYIAKAIIAGFIPQEMNDWIINQQQQGWQFSRSLFGIQFYNFDIMTIRGQSLKQLEGFMGDSVQETSVDFTIQRKLTDDEIEEVIKYCRHDVQETVEVFAERIEEFTSILELLKEFKLPMKYISKTKAQLSAIILDAQNTEDRDDEMDISFVDTLQIKKYWQVVDFYHSTRDYNQTFETNVAGINHIFAWGGLHGAKENYHGKGTIINVDVGSYYPTIMIQYGFLSRNVKDPDKFKRVYHTRLDYKANHDKRQAPYKIVLNSTYGATKDKYNQLYDPRQANNVCVNGMLLLLDLIEKLEPYVELIQSNTDGLYVRLLDDDYFDIVDDICYEWEQRTGMGLEFKYFDEVFQKDVNNYIMIDRESGYVKTKGSYVKSLNNLDFDLPIVNKAVVDYFVNETPIEQTVNDCDDLRMFQRIVKLSYKFDGAQLGNKKIPGKCHRVFASKDLNVPQLFKLKLGHPEKISYTPDHVFIVNDDVNGVPVPDELDRQWYIKVAKERAREFS